MMTTVEAPTSDKFQILPPEEKKMGDQATKFIVICVGLTSVFAVVALILSIVSVSKNGSNEFNIYPNGMEQLMMNQSGVPIAPDSRPDFRTDYNGDRIWRFHIGHFGSNTQYLDEASGTIRGYDVDVMDAVCQIANKNCVLIWDLYDRCWNSEAGERPRGGIGLMGDWYDGCIGWIKTRDRARTYIFSREIEQIFLPAFWVKTGGSFPSYPNLLGLKVGFLDGWWADEHCLNRYNITGFSPDNATQVNHYQVEDDVIRALVSGEVDVAFIPRLPYLDVHSAIEVAVQIDKDLCALSGASIMIPKVNQELADWYDAAFNKLVGTSQYRTICANLREDHAHIPGADADRICVT